MNEINTNSNLTDAISVDEYTLDDKFIVANDTGIAQYNVDCRSCGGALYFDATNYMYMMSNKFNNVFKNKNNNEAKLNESKLNGSSYYLTLSDADAEKVFGSLINNKCVYMMIQLNGTYIIMAVDFWCKIIREGTKLLCCHVEAEDFDIPVFCPDEYFSKIKGDIKVYE